MGWSLLFHVGHLWWNGFQAPGMNYKKGLLLGSYDDIFSMEWGPD